MDFFLAGGFTPHTMCYCVCLALVPCFMRKHLEPLPELEGCAQPEPRLQARGCSGKNTSGHEASASSYPVAASDVRRVGLTQALPCVLIRQSTRTYFCFMEPHPQGKVGWSQECSHLSL